jgi:hypothetical protein
MALGIGTWLAGLALLLIVAALVALPLFDRKTPSAEPPSPRDALEAERQAVVRGIRELDLDFRTRKLDEGDYRALRQAQVQRGAEILRRIEAIDQAAGGARSAAELAAARIDAEIEARVAALKAGVPDGGAAQARAPAACPSCGAPARAGDLFCGKCGQRLG